MTWTPEKQRAHNKMWYEAHREEQKAKMRAYYQANKDKWQKYKPDKARKSEADKAYREANREAIRVWKRDYHQANREKIQARVNEWQAANPERTRDLKSKSLRLRRARMANAQVVEAVDIEVLGDRDGWICGICRGLVDRTLVGPHPLCKSHDHVIPLSKGGDHSYANAQLAHMVCNSRKSTKIPER